MARAKTAPTQVLSNFSITRGLSPTSGYMFSEMPDGECRPVKVTKKSLLGTQSQFGAAEDKASVGNPQSVEIAYLDRDSDTLVVTFGLKAWRDPEIANIDACNLASVERSIKGMSAAYADAGGFKTLGDLYAARIAEGAPLWRNKYGFDRSVEIVIRKGSEDPVMLRFEKIPDAKKIGTLGSSIEHGLAGRDPVDIEIIMRSRMGKGQEVFPSQEMAINSSVGKVLDKDEHNQAMMHPWKLGNAIRHIDIWHPAYDDVGVIAVEVYGTNVRRQEAFRYHDVGFYNYLKQVVDGQGEILQIMDAKTVEELDAINDAHYFMAVMVRGGVFGMGKKKQGNGDAGASE